MTQARLLAPAAVLALGLSSAFAQPAAENMSFFVTSMNPGTGGNLGGLSGADAHCQSLAEAAGAGDKSWHAYLSTSSVDAKDRIGDGPWYNAAGVMIAGNVAELHGENHLMADTALTEKGTKPNYLGGDEVPQPLQHDILTGTNEDGTANEMTCDDWTDGSADSQAMLGHADRLGRNPGVNSWNAVHPSQGCALDNLRPTGGEGLFYCFAMD